jgi:hypothetical protein
VKCDFVRYENKAEAIIRIHSWNLLAKNSLGGVKKILKRPFKNEM